MPRWVLLRHTLPDGSSHHDWMLERGEQRRGGASGGLLTFRLPAGVNPLDSSLKQFGGERIGLHRREYLEYEGPVSGGRGVVARIDSGLCEVVDSPPDGMSITLYHSDLRSILTWRGRLMAQGDAAAASEPWVFELAV